MVLRNLVLFLAVAYLTAAAPSLSKEDSSEESTTASYGTIPGKAVPAFVTPETHRSRRDTTGSEPAPDRRPLTKPSPPESQPQHTSTQHKRDTTSHEHEVDRRPLTKPSPVQTNGQPQQTTSTQHKRDTTSHEHEPDRRPLTKPSPAQTDDVQAQHTTTTTQHKRSAEETPKPDRSHLTKPAQPVGSKTGPADTFDIKHRNRRETPTREERPQDRPSVQPIFPSPPQHDDTFDIKRKEKRDTTSEEHSEEHVDRRPLTKPFPAPGNSQPEPASKTEHKRETAEKKQQTNTPVVSTLPARPVDASKPQH